MRRFTTVRNDISMEEILAVPPVQGLDIEAIFTRPDAAEVFSAVMALKNNRAPDIVGVQAEVLKAAVQHQEVLHKLTELVLRIWDGGDIPDHWLESLGCTIWKGKHPKCDTDNWRLINIIVISSKVVSKMAHWRMQKVAVQVWQQTQYGFRADMWTMDAGFVVLRLMEEFRTTKAIEGEDQYERYRNTLYMMFEDYSQAFDGVQRNVLWTVLEVTYGMPQQFVSMLRKFHDGFKTYTVVNNKYGGGFTTTSGVRQGCITGPDLWNNLFQVVMWAIARRVIRQNRAHGIAIRYNPDGVIRSRSEALQTVTSTDSVKDVSFADDAMVGVAGLNNTMVFDEFYAASKAFGLQVSLTNIAPNIGKDGKTVAMRVSRRDVGWQPRDGEDHITCGPAVIPLVENFVHLGMLRSTKNDLGVREDVERRIRKATSVMGTLEGVWRDKNLSRNTKARMMTLYALPTGLYGDSNWPLTRRCINRLRWWWNKMTRWVYGIHTYYFQDVGKTHDQLREELGIRDIMTYVRRRVIGQIGHIARMRPDNPAKQLMFGFVDERTRDKVIYRRGGRGRQSTRPPRMILNYYMDTLKTVMFPGFDIRIWQLQAQDKSFWQDVVRGATFELPRGGDGPRGPSAATVADRLRAEQLEAAGETTREMTVSGRTMVRSKCPLHCGWVGCNVMKHIASAHPLHPTIFRCSNCDRKFKFKDSMTRHLRNECIDAHSVTEVLESNVYKWDIRKKYLRTYAPGTPLPIRGDHHKPYPEGWLLSKRRKVTPDQRRVMLELGAVEDEDLRAEGIRVWNGKDGAELLQRSAERQQILDDAGVEDAEDLTPDQRRRFFRTMAFTNSDVYLGWGKNRLPLKGRPRVRNRVMRVRRCQRRCGWDDHVVSTRTTCPLHPNYQGPKPRGATFGSEEGRRWRVQQAEAARVLAEKRERIRVAQEASMVYPCPRGCGQSFSTKASMQDHKRSCLADGLLHVKRCTTPGCTFADADLTKLAKHSAKCRKSFLYQSPTGQACGFSVNNRVWSEENQRWEKKGHSAQNLWRNHLNRYSQTRQVDCDLCGEPHLVPWCLKSPRQMDRGFRCSDNFVCMHMGSADCRRWVPRDGGDLPEWMDEPYEVGPHRGIFEVTTEESTTEDGGNDDDDGHNENILEEAVEDAPDESANDDNDVDDEEPEPDIMGDTDYTAVTAEAEETGTAAQQQIDHPHINAWAAAPAPAEDQPAPDLLLLPPLP